ncbi:toxin YafO [Escherichia coli]|uniref:Type II toxin-antitoxin system YafO family toxin n=1 Tax=Escherichia coli O111 TaxID=1055535 RepID=A0AAD2ZFT3_ECOLX|nr:type II toxin-antitoxin system YafO family toxin [Escherichia coli]EFW2415329.1 toxin YafO [Shigella sonnei]ELP2902253.1 type II toxin-antitoxin system YafO family toxin [Escherichia coli O111]APG37854.1 toxin YafO [Escherichia coli]AWZ55293.1 toxin YafO [Escherichia coli]AWZ60514.1 toxin YafO [Escherichia coli]
MKITWNSDSYAQFLKPTFDIKPDLEITLLNDFKSFKQGMYPAIFGKDGPYTAPGAIVSSRVYHVHLLFTKQERTSSRSRFNCTSDRALVYSQHAHFQDVYSLLAIFPNNAHQYAKDPKIMVDIAAYAAAFQALTNP